MRTHNNFIQPTGNNLGFLLLLGNPERTTAENQGVAPIVLRGHSKFVNSVAFSIDGKKLVSSS